MNVATIPEKVDILDAAQRLIDEFGASGPRRADRDDGSPMIIWQALDKNREAIVIQIVTADRSLRVNFGTRRGLIYQPDTQGDRPALATWGDRDPIVERAIVAMGGKCSKLDATDYQYVEAIEALTAERNVPPTVREIAAALGVASTSTVAYRVDRLELAGVISRKGARGSHRSITVAKRLGTSLLDVAP